MQDEVHAQTQSKERDQLMQQVRPTTFLFFLSSVSRFESIQLAESRQEIAVLRQDKDYLSRQANDNQQKYFLAEEKLVRLENSLDELKRAKEELYEKYISSRFVDQIPSELVDHFLVQRRLQK